MIRGEYTTVPDVRTAYLSMSASTGTADDALLLGFIRAACQDIDSVARRTFYPVIETRAFDAPRSAIWSGWDGDNAKTRQNGELLLDGDLLALTTLTNGDGTTISASDYALWPYNRTPYASLRLKPTSGLAFTPTAAGEWLQALSVAGVWGYHPRYADAWVDTLATVQNNPLASSGTSLTVATGLLKPGWLIRFGTGLDWNYVSSVTAGSPNDTCAIVRAVNGGTAAQQAQGTAIYRWEVPFQVELLAMQGAAAYYNLRKNPVGETVAIDGNSFSTPKDVRVYLDKAIREQGLLRDVIG